MYPHGHILGLRKPKRISTNTNRSYYQRASFKFSLNRFNDSDLVLTNPVGKDKVQESNVINYLPQSFSNLYEDHGHGEVKICKERSDVYTGATDDHMFMDRDP